MTEDSVFEGTGAGMPLGFLKSPSLVTVPKVNGQAPLTVVKENIDQMWSRLWANSFLLRMPQYFLTHTYEGRLNTPLKGEWDLNGSLISVALPQMGSIRLNSSYTLEKKTSPFYLQARLDPNWNDLERNAAGARWTWSKGDAGVQILNPQATSLVVAGSIEVRSPVDRDFQVWVAGRMVASARIGPKLTRVAIPAVTVPPGEILLSLRSPQPPTVAGPGDSRRIGFAAHGIELQVVRPSAQP